MAQMDDYEQVAGPEALECPGALLLLDEIDLLAPPPGYREDWVHDAVHYGRHLQVTVIGASRRPANIHRDLTALASTVYIGTMTEPRDLEYCVRAWGEQCYQARDLPLYRFLKISP